MIEIIALILGFAFAGASLYALDLHRKAMDNKATYQRLNEISDRREKRIAELDNHLSERDRRITTLDEQLSDANDQLTEAQEDITAKLNDWDYKKALMLTLANSSYDALFVVDQNSTIIASNTRAEALFSEKVLVGKKLKNVTKVDELDMMVEDALRNEEEPFEVQVSIDNRFFRVNAQVIRREGHLFLGVALQDITQLVRLNRARRDMVANISHELRTPISNIRITIDSLFLDQDKPKRKDSIASLRAIARETDNLMWLVQEMYDLAMIESGQSIVRMVDVPLGELIDEAIDRIKDQSELKEITIVKHIPDQFHVLCDRDLAQRVIVNLLHNALKWSPDGEMVTVSATNGGDEVTISVLDNGPGVPEDKVDRIFERFYQVDDSRSQGEGTGLGLAICKHIVEAHGGRIWAEGNTKGSGGRFLFTLLSSEEKEETTEEAMTS